MVRRSARLLLEILGALLAGATIAVALVAWRLSAGPIALEFLTPYLEEALSSPDGPRIEIDRTVVVWQGWNSNPELRAEGVTARRPDGAAVATVPAVGLSLSLDTLLVGGIAPTRVELVEPRLHLLRDADGNLRVDIGGGGNDRPGDPRVAEDLLAELMGPVHRGGVLAQLRRLSIRDARIVVDDRMLGRTWTLPDGDFVLRRGDRGLEGTLALDLDLGPRLQRLEGTFRHDRDEGRTDVTLGFEVPDPAELATLAPELAPLADIHLPVRGEAALSLTLPDRIHVASLSVSAGAGRIAHPVMPGGGLDISSAQARLRWEADRGHLALEDLFVDLGGPTLAVTGTVDGLGVGYLTRPDARGPLQVAMETSIVDLPTAALAQLWPEMVVRGGRRWVTANIADGGVRDAQIRLGVTLPPGGEPQVTKLDGVFSYQGLTVTYLNGLPPVRQVHGTARFDDQQMVLEVAGGTLLRSTHVERSTIRLTDFDKRDQQIAIEAQTAGPVREGLEVIDRPRLGFLSRFGLRPADVSGDASVRMSFAFPAIDALRMDDVRLRVTAAVRNGAMPTGVRDWRLTDADLAFDVDKERLELSGTGRLQGVPVQITGREAFASTAPILSEYTLKGQLGDDARRRLGYDLAPWVTGPADVDLSYRSRAEHRSELLVRANLAPATVRLAPVGWSKPPGRPGSAELAVEFAGDRVVRLRTLRASGPGLAFEGAADFTGPAWSLDIARATVGRTQLAGSVRSVGGGYEASLRGPVLDLGPLLDGAGTDKGGGATPIRLDARFDRVLLGEQRSLDAVAVSLDLDGKGRRRGRLDGRLANGGRVTASIAPGADGKEQVEAETSDFGALLRAFADRDTFRGGTLRLRATISKTDGKDVIAGTVRGADYRLVRAPAATKLLSVLSLTSLVSLLQGDGLPFADLRFSFVGSGGRFQLRQGRAYGGAIGGTFEGTVDTEADTLDIEGTVVPAYTLNNLLGNIPILGTLLAGGKDEGVFAANFRIAGPIDDPGVSVNPLSALAPGILRKMFPFLEATDPRANGGGAPDFRQDGTRPAN